jgi:hypothetical protein
MALHHLLWLLSYFQNFSSTFSYSFLRFEVCTAASIEALQFVAPSSLVGGCQQFEETYSFVIDNGSIVNYGTKCNVTCSELEESSSVA